MEQQTVVLNPIMREAFNRVLAWMRQVVCVHRFDSPVMHVEFGKPFLTKRCGRCGCVRHGHTIIKGATYTFTSYTKASR